MNRNHSQNLAGLRVTVMGLGTFGGGVGAIRYLVSHGAEVTVTDLRTADELADSLAAIRDTPPARLHLGEHRPEDFRTAELVVASPAIPKNNRYLAQATAAGIPITSEIALFWERNRGRTLCITGSNGKSTTTALAHALWSACCPKHCWLGGNIGVSLLPVVDRISAEDWVVLELSSFQLEDLATLRPAPDVAIVTNFSPNHLDRHGTLDHYRTAKQNLLRWQTADQVAVLNQDDPEVALWPTAARKVWSGMHDQGREGAFALDTQQVRFRSGGQIQEVPLQSWLQLPGRHNLRNALAAAAAVVTLGAAPADLQTAVSRFAALPHRLQCVT
jgi:UDP-N-acetylmuramoylalanine--D-glutamate ligase